jgi:hypothetical protein
VIAGATTFLLKPPRPQATGNLGVSNSALIDAMRRSTAVGETQIKFTTQLFPSEFSSADKFQKAGFLQHDRKKVPIVRPKE